LENLLTYVDLELKCVPPPTAFANRSLSVNSRCLEIQFSLCGDGSGSHERAIGRIDTIQNCSESYTMY
jgi:hypothetical protein